MDISLPQTQNTAQNYLPEPDQSALGQFINTAVSTGAQIASSALNGTLGSGTLGGISSLGSGAVGGVPTTASGSFADLINAQIQVQLEMQTTSLISNIEHSRHETKMAAIRNIRVG